MTAAKHTPGPYLRAAAACHFCHERMPVGALFRWEVLPAHRGGPREGGREARHVIVHPAGVPCLTEKKAAERAVEAERGHASAIARMEARGTDPAAIAAYRSAIAPRPRRICPACDLPPTSDCAFANCKREFAEFRAIARATGEQQ